MTSPPAPSASAGAPADWCSVADAAKLLDVHRTTVWRWLRSGRLPGYRAGARTVRIRRTDLDRVLTALSHGATPDALDDEHQARALIEQASDGVFLADLAGRYIDVNVAGCRMLGCDRAEIVGRPITDFIPPADWPRLAAVREQLLAGDTQVAEWTLLRKDGTHLPVEISTKILPDGRWQGIVRDVTERQQARAERARLLDEARAAEARYRALFEDTTDAILVADTRARYLDANQAACDLLGYTREELLQLGVADVAAPGPAWTALEYERFKEDSAWRGELELRRKDGTLVPVEARASVIGEGSEAVFCSILRDISERRAVERLQREFIAMIAHDLRNPLASIAGYAQLMRRRQAYSDSGVQAILDQTRRLDRLIADLMDAAQVEAGRLQIRPAPAALGSLVRASAEQAAASSPAHTIRLQAPADLPTGRWDADRIMQVLQNLLGNAIKYSPDGGEILVRVENGGHEARVSVRDQGQGIPADALPRVFDRFYRAADATASATPGLGLGLHITRALVEAHGGTIHAESAGPGQGSTFVLTLPYTAPTVP